MIFLGLKFWPESDFFVLRKTPGFFLGSRKKKQRDFFGLRKKD